MWCLFSFHILWNSVCWFRIWRVGGQHWTSCTYIFSTMPAVTFRIGNVGWLNFCCYTSQVKSVRCNFKSLNHYLSWHVNNFLKINVRYDAAFSFLYTLLHTIKQLHYFSGVQNGCLIGRTLGDSTCMWWQKVWNQSYLGIVMCCFMKMWSGTTTWMKERS